MPFSPAKSNDTFSGIVFVAIIAAAATWIAALAPVAKLGISPLVVGIVIGIFYANTLHNRFPAAWEGELPFRPRRFCVSPSSFTVFVLPLHRLPK